MNKSALVACLLLPATSFAQDKIRVILKDEINRAVCITSKIEINSETNDPRPELPVIITCEHPIWVRVGSEWRQLPDGVGGSEGGQKPK